MADRLNPTHFTLRLLRIRTRASLAAAHGVRPDSTRLLTVVGLHCDGDLGETAGWGECSALNAPGYTHEWSEGAFELLRVGRPFDPLGYPMAAAAIEMALLDADLKHAGQTLAERVGTVGKSAPAGAVVGLAPIPVMLDEVEQLVDQGYGRIKCKIAPGKLASPIEAISSAFPDIELHVDANASLRAEHLPALLHLRDRGVTAVEQPFAVEDRATAIRLIDESDMAVIADEAIEFAGDIDDVAAEGAATAIALKPPKLGGIAAAREALDRAETVGLAASIGGMLESGLGRHVLAALAPLPGFTLTGDLSPAKRWLIEDPFRDVKMRGGQIEAPDRPGIAGDPVKTRLERATVRKTIVAAPPLIESLRTR